MKTIEQAAKEYAGCEYSKEQKYFYQCYTCAYFTRAYECPHHREKDAFEMGVEFAESWIKVEDELPENQDIVFVKTDKGCYGTGYLLKSLSGFITYGSEAHKEFGEVIEWRPINQK
jgi:hypothetical protein